MKYKTWQGADNAVKRAKKLGYSIDITRNTKREANTRVKNLKKWGYKVKVIQYPNNVVVLMKK